MRALKALTVLAATTALTACITPHSGNDGLYALPIGDAPVTANPTAYTPALNCLNAHARNSQIAAPRIAVGRILELRVRHYRCGVKPLRLPSGQIVFLVGLFRHHLQLLHRLFVRNPE